jgi:hypothetical protein
MGVIETCCKQGPGAVCGVLEQKLVGKKNVPEETLK